MTIIAETLKVKIFADGADLAGIEALRRNPLIKGFTTNPTLMRKAGIEDYEAFSRQVIRVVGELPISLEVFADTNDEMEAQGRVIASWGANVFVKIPVTNSEGVSTTPIIKRLSDAGVALNVTALMTAEQVELVMGAVNPQTPAIISVFAGRIADTGIAPVPVMARCLDLLRAHPKAELLWASPRELFNLIEADQCGCHIITVGHDILAKLNLFGRDLIEYSLDTVKMFRRDAVAAGYQIAI